MSPRLPDVKRLVILWFMFAISSALTCILLGMYQPPHVHPTSGYVIADDQFTRLATLKYSSQPSLAANSLYYHDDPSSTQGN